MASTGGRSKGLFRRLQLALLTRDPRQRIRLAQSGLANLLMAGCVVMTNVLDAAGLVNHRWIGLWTFCSVGGMVAIFALIRSGRVLHWRDPSLTLQQMFYAVLCAAVAYCITGTERAVVIPILAVVLMFGMFGLSQRQMFVVGAYTMVLFGSASVFLAAGGDGGWQSWAVELARFLMIAIVMAGVIVLTGRLHDMRERSRKQRIALSTALERISVLATRDELTGCFNRRAMIERMEDELLRSKRSGRKVCIVLLDLDHFKRINDAFGHAAGDAVLREFAEVARSHLRTSDMLARWGGEEFLLLLSDTDLESARHCAQRLLDDVAAARSRTLPEGEVVTCSAGAIECRPGETIGAAIERSDLALYQAKRDGRNRVVCG